MGVGTNLGSCPDCSREISLRAKSCPHCGSPKPFATPISEMPVVKPVLSGGKIFFGGVWVFVKTAFWWALGVAIVRGTLFGLAGGLPGLAVGLGGGVALGGVVGTIVGFFFMVAYWIRGGPKQYKPTLREKMDALHALKQAQLGKPQKVNPHDTPLFMVDDDGQHGPFNKQQLTDRLSKGEFSADALCSENGTKDWYELKSWNK